MIRPQTTAELSGILREADHRREQIGGIDLSGLNRVLEHTPEDLTITVEAGIVLLELQNHLAGTGQWLPIDPPRPESTSIEKILSNNLSGPRRFGFGTIREHLIGLRAVLADGRVIKSGGKVVKNVAGYDLLKLFVGGQGTLGVIVEATFKLRPLPESERFLQLHCQSLLEAEERTQSILDSPLTPSVFDLHNLRTGSSGCVKRPGEECIMVAGFSGGREEVEWQTAQAAKLGLREAGTLEHERLFFESSELDRDKISVLPSRCVAAIRELGSVPFVARAGNGIIYSAGAPPRPLEAPSELCRRIKAAYDPNRLFPELKL